MNAVVAITPAQMPVGFEAWMAQGRQLLERRDAIEWDLADWIAGGEDQFGKQLGLDLLADQLGIAPKRLRTAAKVAKAFPAAHRAPGLPFDVYQEIARVEPDQRLPMLSEAARDHWTQAVAYDRVEQLRTCTRLTNDDKADALGAEIIRAWNRAGSPEVREWIWPYLLKAAQTGFGTINMEVEINA